MIGVPLDTKLNLLWAAMTVVAFVALAVMEPRQRPERMSRGASLRRLVCVGILSLTVFPSISSSDDLLSFSFFQFPINGHDVFGNAPRDETREKPNLHLARVLQTLQNVQVARFHAFGPMFGSLAVTANLRALAAGRAAACRTGRAPPPKLSI